MYDSIIATTTVIMRQFHLFQYLTLPKTNVVSLGLQKSERVISFGEQTAEILATKSSLKDYCIERYNTQKNYYKNDDIVQDFKRQQEEA